MKALIVIAHPEPLSMNHSMMAVMTEQLMLHGWSVEKSDLYADGFKMAPSPADFNHRSNPMRFSLVHEQRNASVSNSYHKEILSQQNVVKDADLIIFQFPLWWGIRFQQYLKCNRGHVIGDRPRLIPA